VECRDFIYNSLNFNLWKNNPLRRFYNFPLGVDKHNDYTIIYLPKPTTKYIGITVG